MDTSEAPCSRKAKRQQKVEIQQDAFDIDDDEEIPIITEETEEELAAFEAVNRPRTTSGKIRVTEEVRPETAASLKYRPKSGRSTFDSRPTTAVSLKTKSRTVSRASSRKSRAESGFSRQDRGQYYDSDSDEEPRSPTKRDLFLEAELSNVDSILADDKAFDTDLEVEGKPRNHATLSDMLADFQFVRTAYCLDASIKVSTDFLGALKIEDVIENLYPINIGETTTTYDRKTDYINDCKKNGIVPASYFLRHMEKPQLTMSHHGLGEEGMKCIARSLASNTTVLNLDISDNWLGDTGGLIVCNMLKENIYITDLTLRDNRLGFGCAEQIGEVMKTNSTLTHLTLSVVLVVTKYEQGLAALLTISISDDNISFWESFEYYSYVFEGMKLLTIVGCLSNFLIYIIISKKMRAELSCIFCKQTSRSNVKEMNKHYPMKISVFERIKVIKKTRKVSCKI
ncbi:unnamed protein product [Mytilus coruscus]|uniref:Uncharacterized protein n=1 Tax=Mytilus coruscus TaxID=42192 RepID=A0A6J8BEU8_MYTCO|nr:unnamed protein product [Mytilus coruscus]